MEAAFFCYYLFLIFWVPAIFPALNYSKSILSSFLIQFFNNFKNLKIKLQKSNLH